MSLAPYIHAMGRGPSRGRGLTQTEAADAMTQILSGDVAPEALGALLMLMRYRGETADEVAGFAQAARAEFGCWDAARAALDWPSYAAGRSRGLPWFLLSAKLVAQAGYPVLLHGWNSHQNPIASVREGCRALSIPFVGSPDCAKTAIARGKIAYAPLEALDPRLVNLLRLRDALGLRSVINTVCRMLNPARADAMVQGVFHPSYRELQQDAAVLLGYCNLRVLKGGGGEFERHPGKAATVFGLASGQPISQSAPEIIPAHRRLADGLTDRAVLGALWHGEITDPWAEAIVTGTAALAFSALEPSLSVAEAEDVAASHWAERHKRLAA